MLRIGILVSGGGTNFQAIVDKIKSGYIKYCEIVSVVSSRENAYALKRAEKCKIPACVIARKEYKTVGLYDQALLEHFKKNSIDLVVMAGFLSILGEKFVGNYKNRIINVHPSLIPSFCGKGYYGIIPHEKALEYGVKVTGATVHFVDVEADTGPIILQKSIDILPDDTAEMLQKRVMQEIEWEILPEAVKLFAEGRLEVVGRKVMVK